MLFDWSTGALAEGLGCYNNGAYFDAHEHWEELWRAATGTDKILLQALIQLSVALCHQQRGNRKGTLSMLGKSLALMERCPDNYGGIELARLRAEAESWLEAIRLDHAMPPAPRIR